ncbi:MAG: NYN domain-containing protein, partial [Vicinamibacteria bacterium]
MAEEPKLALFIDLENIAIGARDAKFKSFEISRVLERLVEKGKIIVKKAYADWGKYRDYKRPFHEAGIELIDIPQRSYSGKNSADIKMVVDAIDLSYSKEHINFFAVVSGDSDFVPLVSKLKENDKTVIGVGLKNSTSDLLASNCDEFIFYDDLVKQTSRTPARVAKLPKRQQECFELVLDAIDALERENKEVIW